METSGSNSRSNFHSNFGPSRFISIALIAAIIIAATVGAFYYFDKEKPLAIVASASVFMKPTLADSGGVSRDTAFVVTSQDPIDKQVIEDTLQIKPLVKFAVEQTNPNEVRLKPEEPLQPNTVYQFVLPTQERPISWAFQVKGEFHITGTIPSDRATQVPVASGIEINFTHENFQDFEKYFLITPTVSGRFEKHKRTMVFVPKDLKEKTVYTVKISKGLPLSGSDLKLEEDKIFTFETAAANESSSSYFDVSSNQVEWSNVGDQFLFFYSDGEEANKTLEATVYKMTSDDQYIQSYKKFRESGYWSTFNKYPVEEILKGSQKTGVYQLPIQKSSYDQFVTMPEKLANGYYLIALKHSNVDQVGYVWVQVTNVSGNINLNRKNGIVWAHDLNTKNPLQNAKVHFSDGTDAKTDSDGVATFPLPESFYMKENRREDGNEEPRVPFQYATIQGAGDDQLILFFDGQQVEKKNSNDYWSYLYFDRPVYRQNDTVSFWGLSKPKERGEKFSQLKATLSSSNGYFYEYDFFGEATSIEEQTLAVTSLGTFSGEWKLKDFPSGSYTMGIWDGDVLVRQRSFEIANYVKPAYEIDVQVSKEKIFAGDSVNVNVHAHFFEGTPVPFKKFRLFMHGYEDKSQEITTDKFGRASVQFTSVYRNGQYWPQHEFFQVTPVSEEEGEIVGNANVNIYGPDMTLESKTTSKGNQFTIRVTAQKVDLSAVDTKGQLLPNFAFEGQLIETHYKKILEREDYDFINKKKVPVYHYEKSEVVNKTVPLVTDGNGVAKYDFTRLPEQSLRFEINTISPNQRKVFHSAWLWSFNEGDYYELKTDDDHQSRYRIGEEETFTLQKGGKTAEEDSYLYVVTSSSKISYTAQRSPIMKLKFLEDFISGARVDLYRFTGKTYESMGYEYMWLDTEKEKNLSIELEPDQKVYRPGDTVHLNVITKKDGRAVAGEVNISLVDKAYFKLFGYYADPLGSIYSSTYLSDFYTYSSHNPTPFRGGGGAEKGGGGGDARSNFKDKAFFGNVVTGGNGRGEVSFKLPDNLTAWKITAQGVTEDVDAGLKEVDLPVKLPFFVDTVIAEEFIVADKPVIALRTFGDNLAPENNVKFSIDIPSLGVKEKVLNAKGFEAVDFALPALAAGDHEIKISAEANGMKDALLKKIHVIPSRITMADAETIKLADYKQVPENILNSRAPVNAVIQDIEKARLYEALWNFMYDSGIRFDQRAALMKARDFANEYFDGEFGSSSSGQTLADIYQNTDGGVRLLPYSDSELELSAKTAVLASATVNEDRLRSYFYTILQEEESKKFPLATRERYIMALSSLGALHEPVLINLQALVQEKDLNPLEKLYLASGLMAAGDQETARGLVQNLLQNNAEKIGSSIRLKVGKDNDDMMQHTALAAVLAADLGFSERDALAQYLLQQPTRDILTSLEQVSYIGKRLPSINKTDAEVTYSLNGKEKSETLRNGNNILLRKLSSEMLKTLKFEKVKGDLSVTFSYVRGATKDELKKDPNIGVQRIYSLDGKPVTSWKSSDIVLVELQPKFGEFSLNGCYQLMDHLPSGVVPLSWNVGIQSSEKGVLRPYDIEGQDVKFCIYKDQKARAIKFPVRTVNKGTYVSEPATLQMSSQPGSLNASDEVAVTIQ